MIRPATPDDAPELARLHVQAYAESYPGILPDDIITGWSVARRLEMWEQILAAGKTEVVIAPGKGFAAAGPQRQAGYEAEYPQELYLLYVLEAEKGSGLGQRLLTPLLRPPMTAVVLAENPRARRFYEKAGARFLARLPPEPGERVIEDVVYGWGTPAPA
ncbi:N-acetyltransferase family protein [Pseudoroseicyclus sp. H15]